jgi:hypothetical protein
MKREAGTDSATCRHILSIDFQDELWTNATEPFALHGAATAPLRAAAAHTGMMMLLQAVQWHSTADVSKIALKCGNI